jgi:glycolate oxidase FAD binding subunit
VLAVGLSGHRRLRYGPLRDRVLEVRFVTADGRLVKGGGPTVKNVSGFDIPRLLVGSFGTIGVLVQVILRCQPLPEIAEWSATDDDPFEVRRRTYRPSCVAWDGERTSLLAEGVAADVERERRAAGTEPVPGPPPWPEGPHRGRISIAPASLRGLVPELQGTGVHWLAEIGVGTIHVAAGAEEQLAAARAVAEKHGGWLLREAGAPDTDGFGRALPNLALMQRIRTAFDPTGKLGRGRLPLESQAPVDVDGETSYV